MRIARPIRYPRENQVIHVQIKQHTFFEFRQAFHRTDVKRMPQQRCRNVVASDLDGSWRAGEFSLDAPQVMKNMAAISSGFPRTIRHDPIYLAEDSFPQGRTDEIGDRNVLFGCNPPNVVVSIYMDQDAVHSG